MKFLYQPPKIMRTIFPEFIWESTREKIMVTFDDGPNPLSTEKILRTLKEEEITALFFCVGNNVERYPQLAKAIAEEKHLLGNHTFQHKIITKLNSAELEREIMLTNEIIGNVCGVSPKYFRPPHGRFPFSLGKKLNRYQLKNVMWSLLPYDYKNDIKVVKLAIKNYLTAKSIIVLHDSNKSVSIICDTIKYLAEEARSKNFQFGTPNECLS